MARWRTRLRALIRRSGYDLAQARPTVVDLLRQRRIDVVLDVGANRGQYGAHLRAWGYRGRIVSFEPFPEAVAALRAASADDPAWSVVPVALGADDTEADLHVAQASVFSSLREPLPAVTDFDTRARSVGAVRVPVRRLGDVFGDHVADGERVFLKIDTQGSEMDVLAGAADVLDRVVGVQLELSVKPLYTGELTAPALIAHLESEGFRIGQVEPVVYDPVDGLTTLLQADVVFVRAPEAA